MIWLWRLLLLILVGGLATLSLGYRLHDIAPDDYAAAQRNLEASQPKKPEPTNENKTPDEPIDKFASSLVSANLIPPIFGIAWPERSDALVEQAQQALQQQDIPEAERLALRALTLDITNGRAAAQLLATYQNPNYTPKNNELMDSVAELASYLWPAHSFVRGYVADYWQSRGDIPHTLAEWSVLLTRNGGLGQTLYPILQNMASNPATFLYLQPFIEQPPKWWEGFLNYLASSKGSLPVLQTIYEARKQSKFKLTLREQQIMIQRLMSEKAWDSAYFTWLSSLDEREANLGGFVYDGGFEGLLYNNGFTWQVDGDKMLRITPTITNGMKGGKALRVTLNDTKRINFQHLSQRLLLLPGDYQFSARYRLDQLRNEAGLTWRIRCLDDQKELLGESSALRGQSNWSELTFNFTVPDKPTCIAQLLRLEATSPYPQNHLFRGTVWFDDIKISVPPEPEDAPQ